MASIIKSNKIFGVVHTSYQSGKKKQWQEPMILMQSDLWTEDNI